MPRALPTLRALSESRGPSPPPPMTVRMSRKICARHRAPRRLPRPLPSDLMISSLQLALWRLPRRKRRTRQSLSQPLASKRLTSLPALTTRLQRSGAMSPSLRPLLRCQAMCPIILLLKEWKFALVTRLRLRISRFLSRALSQTCFS